MIWQNILDVEEPSSDLEELAVLVIWQDCVSVHIVPVIWQNCLSVGSLPVTWQNCLYVEE